MREILFRGRRLDNGGWVYGGSIIQFVDDGNLLVYMPQINEKCVATHDENDNITALKTGSFYKIDPATVGQFTGIPDKKGKFIYEWDILDCGDIIVCVVWNEICGAWEGKFIKYSRNAKHSNGVKPEHWPMLATVIGNAADNPELLEVPHD